jgi:hypothetical protein
LPRSVGSFLTSRDCVSRMSSATSRMRSASSRESVRVSSRCLMTRSSPLRCRPPRPGRDVARSCGSQVLADEVGRMRAVSRSTRRDAAGPRRPMRPSASRAARITAGEEHVVDEHDRLAVDAPGIFVGCRGMLRCRSSRRRARRRGDRDVAEEGADAPRRSPRVGARSRPGSGLEPGGGLGDAVPMITPRPCRWTGSRRSLDAHVVSSVITRSGRRRVVVGPM